MIHPIHNIVSPQLPFTLAEGNCGETIFNARSAGHTASVVRFETG